MIAFDPVPISLTNLRGFDGCDTDPNIIKRRLILDEIEWLRFIIPVFRLQAHNTGTLNS